MVGGLDVDLAGDVGARHPELPGGGHQVGERLRRLHLQDDLRVGRARDRPVVGLDAGLARQHRCEGVSDR